MRIAVISVTNQGDLIGKNLSEYFDVKLYLRADVKNRGLRKITEEVFNNHKAIIFISSTGIAVRSTAPFLRSKAVDPAVLVIDSCSKFVISLVSGHLGGANELTLKVADIIKAQPVITTATDNIGVIAPDVIARDNKLIIDDLKICKEIAALLVEGKKVIFSDDRESINLPKGYIKEPNKDITGAVWVTNKESYNEEIYKPPFSNNAEHKQLPILKLIRGDIVLGIGCRKDYSSEEMKKNVLHKLNEFNIDQRAVKSIGTVEIKKDEKAILDLAEYLGCELKIFSLEDIKKVQNHYEGSDFVEKNIGVRAVCEPCVELLGGKPLSEKMKCNGMTLCIGVKHIKINN